jgi:hypothetical protein
LGPAFAGTTASYIYPTTGNIYSNTCFKASILR